MFERFSQDQPFTPIVRNRQQRAPWPIMQTSLTQYLSGGVVRSCSVRPVRVTIWSKLIAPRFPAVCATPHYWPAALESASLPKRARRLGSLRLVAHLLGNCRDSRDRGIGSS